MRTIAHMIRSPFSGIGSAAMSALFLCAIVGTMSAATTTPPSTIDTRDPFIAPTNAAPTDGAILYTETPGLTSSVYQTSYGELQYASQWQLAGTSVFYTVIWDSQQRPTLNSVAVPGPGMLEYMSSYWWRVRHKSRAGGWSPWSTSTMFTVIPQPGTPANVTPANNAVLSTFTPTLTASDFVPDPYLSAAQLSARWQVASNAAFTLIAWDSGEITDTVSYIDVPAGVLGAGTNWWHMKYRNDLGGWSEWSAWTRFRIVPIPATPDNIAPTNGELVGTMEPTLTGTPFQASYPGETQFACQWLVSDTNDFSTTNWNSGILTATFSAVTVPPDTLGIGTSYWWNMRYRSTAGRFAHATNGWSQYSTPTWFVIVPEPACVAAVLLGLLAFRRRVIAAYTAGRRSTTASLLVLCTIACAASSTLAAPSLSNVVAVQRLGEKLLDISYNLYGMGTDVVDITIAASTNGGSTYDMPMSNVVGDLLLVTTGMNKRITWNAGIDWNQQWTSNLTVTLSDQIVTDLYCVIDVSAGPGAPTYPVAFYPTVPVVSDEYKTTSILLRKIPKGTSVMGSLDTELGRQSTDQNRHLVTLSSNFYIGVYEITQAQYSNVVGGNPAFFQAGATAPMRPVEMVSWDAVRGGTWPGVPAGSGAPSNNTFISILRARTGFPFDLPTEAQWEHAGRATTTNALNNNRNITANNDANLNPLARYYYTGGSNQDASVEASVGGTAVVGSYLPNKWGIYDIHGNVNELCLDWGSTALLPAEMTDPLGPAIGTYKVCRGGSLLLTAYFCRSASRYPTQTSIEQWKWLGFRLAFTTGK